jgi:hypothetical protein
MSAILKYSYHNILFCFANNFVMYSKNKFALQSKKPILSIQTCCLFKTKNIVLMYANLCKICEISYATVM